MAVSIKLTTGTTVYNSQNKSYICLLTISATGISPYLFVNQRVTTLTSAIFCQNPKQKVVTQATQSAKFAAIATPQQLATLGIQAPFPGTSFYLDNNTTIVTNTQEYMTSVIQEVVQELENLAEDYTAQSTLISTQYFITNSGVTYS